MHPAVSKYAAQSGGDGGGPLSSYAMEGARLASVSASMAIAAGWFFTRHPFSGGVSFMFGITTTTDSSGSA